MHGPKPRVKPARAFWRAARYRSSAYNPRCPEARDGLPRKHGDCSALRKRGPRPDLAAVYRFRLESLRKSDNAPASRPGPPGVLTYEWTGNRARVARGGDGVRQEKSRQAGRSQGTLVRFQGNHLRHVRARHEPGGAQDAGLHGAPVHPHHDGGPARDSHPPAVLQPPAPSARRPADRHVEAPNAAGEGRFRRDVLKSPGNRDVEEEEASWG